MQVLKDEIRLAILDAAQTRFLAAGYEKTSIEQIARLAGISKSNLYHYFPGKENIFYQLTDSAALKLLDVIQFFSSHSFDPATGGKELALALAERVYPLLEGEWTPILLILQSSVGTRHAALTDAVVEVFARNIALHFPGGTHLLATRMIARNLVHGITEILRCSQTVDEIHRNLLLLARYHTGGMQGLVRSA